MQLNSMAMANAAPDKGNTWLPAGFRFHPTDEELVSFYLAKKFQNPAFTAGPAISEADLNKCEPWDLPGRAKMGEKEWYFYSLRDRKYPRGMRVNRATDAGYWKATGKDREVRNSQSSYLVGWRKTLVFYKGRPPRGVRTTWVLHEYRMKSTHSVQRLDGKPSEDDWVICRIFHKDAGGKRTPFEKIRRPSFLDKPLLLESHNHLWNQEKLDLFSNSHPRLPAPFTKPAPSPHGSAVIRHSTFHLAPPSPWQTISASSDCAGLPPFPMSTPSSNAELKAVQEQFSEESAHPKREASKPEPYCSLENGTYFQYTDQGDILDLPAGQPLNYAAMNPQKHIVSQESGRSCSLQPQAADHPVLISSDLCEKTYNPAVFNRLGWCLSSNSSSLDLGSLWAY